MLTEEQFEGLKRQLQEEKGRLMKKMSDNKHYQLEEGMLSSLGELSGYDNHPADIGTELFERGKDLALNEEDEQQLKEVEMALLRMGSGVYGICEVCGGEIPYLRLEALPEAACCVEHQRQKEVTYNERPAEEDVLRPPFGRRSFNDQKDEHVYFDGEDAWQEVESYGTASTEPGDMSIDENERHGAVDDVELIALAGLDGRPQAEPADVTRNKAFRRKEEEEEEKER